MSEAILGHQYSASFVKVDYVTNLATENKHMDEMKKLKNTNDKQFCYRGEVLELAL